MSLLFNILCRFIIAFLPRGKHLEGALSFGKFALNAVEYIFNLPEFQQ